MMKKKWFLGISCILISMGVSGQFIDGRRIDLNNISIPSSPGFILLDESPTILDRPASPKAFAVNIYNAFKQSGGFPTNYGVEFTPFWYFQHPNMTALKFLGYNAEGDQQLPFSHIRKASLNIAYVKQPDTGSAAGISNLAFGVRTNLFSLRSKRNIQAIKSSNDAVVEILNAFNMEIVMLDIEDTNYQAKVQELVDAFENDPGLIAAEESLQEQIAVKPVFAVDLAFAYSMFFLENTISKQHFGRLGIWTTVNYSAPLVKDPVPTSYFHVYGIFRYLQDGTTMDSTGSFSRVSNLDFGGKAELEIKNLNLALEYIYRQEEDATGNNYRAVGSLSYRLSNSVAITAAFGRNFGEKYNLITLFGMSFGFNSGNETAPVTN
jgi:hypothetical protein